jgi:hypothetical protein
MPWVQWNTVAPSRRGQGAEGAQHRPHCCPRPRRGLGAARPRRSWERQRADLNEVRRGAAAIGARTRRRGHRRLKLSGSWGHEHPSNIQRHHRTLAVSRGRRGPKAPADRNGARADRRLHRPVGTRTPQEQAPRCSKSARTRMPRAAPIREHASTFMGLEEPTGRAAALVQPDRRGVASADEPTSAKSGAARRPPERRDVVEATVTSGCPSGEDIDNPRLRSIPCQHLVQRWPEPSPTHPSHCGCGRRPAAGTGCSTAYAFGTESRTQASDRVG